MAERTDDIGFGGLRLIQDTDHFCYGIDAVLLADLASRGRHKRIADIGTNNGIIPVILAGLTDAERLTGIEKQAGPAGLAARNAELNGFSSRIDIVNSDIMDIREVIPAGTYDAVTCNPPYTEQGRGMVSEDDTVAVARHETSAGLDDFIKAASYLLRDRGMFYMIHRPSRIIDIACSCRQHRLEPKFLRFISPRRGQKPNLMLIQCRKGGGRELKLMEPLAVYGEDGCYTDEIMKIYRRK